MMKYILKLILLVITAIIISNCAVKKSKFLSPDLTYVYLLNGAGYNNDTLYFYYEGTDYSIIKGEVMVGYTFVHHDTNKYFISKAVYDSLNNTSKTWTPDKKYMRELNTKDIVTLSGIRKEHVDGSSYLENDSEVMLHPFSGEYGYGRAYNTETAPFPKVKLNDYKNDYYDSLNVSYKIKYAKTGLKNKSWVHWYYHPEGIITSNDSFLNNSVKISSYSTHNLGKSFHTFWFNKKYGFVKSYYKFYNGDSLEIKLIRISKD